MSSISAGTSSGTALVQTADTTGALVIKTGGSAATAATFNADQTVTLAAPLPVASGGTGATSLSGITVGTATSATTATTATNLAGGSNGTIPYQSAAGTTQMLAVGTSGQVLKSNGVAAPSWITPSAGAMTLISTSTFSSASTVDFTGLSGYTNYRIIITGVTIGSAGTIELRFGRPTIVTAGYGYSQIYLDSVAIQRTFNATNQNRIYLISSDISTNVDYGVAGSIDIFNFGAGGLPKVISNLAYRDNSTNGWSFFQTWGFLADTTPASVIRILSGGLITGTISLYGISS
jgi:hypothetical protein